MTMTLIGCGGFFLMVWCCIGWSMYRAPTDIELWGEEME